MIFDDVMWLECDDDDLWIYDKLILSRKLGYVCGPAGVPVPEPGLYIVRPITNLEGMGRSAEFVWLDCDTDHLTPGLFWCEIFEGQHVSVDYVFGDPILTVEGVRDPKDPLHKWSRWQKVNVHIPLPEILASLHYEQINCEFIGGNLIEVHLRHNPDFEHGCPDHVIPVWEGESIDPPDGYTYREDPESVGRLGFFVPI